MSAEAFRVKAGSENEAELLAIGGAVIALRKRRLSWVRISEALDFSILELQTLCLAYALTAAQQGEPADGHPLQATLAEAAGNACVPPTDEGVRRCSQWDGKAESSTRS